MILFELRGNEYMHDCPLLLKSGSLFEAGGTRHKYVVLVFRNLSMKKVISAEVELYAFDSGKIQVGGATTHHYAGETVGEGEEFGENEEIRLSYDRTAMFVPLLVNVTFEDGSMWKNANHTLFRPLPRQEEAAGIFPLPELMKQYQIEINEEAVYLPRQIGDLWLCACGEINTEESCRRCHATHEQVFRATDMDYFKKRLQERLQTEALQQKLQEKKRRRRPFLILLALIVVLLALLSVFLLGKAGKSGARREETDSGAGRSKVASADASVSSGAIASANASLSSGAADSSDASDSSRAATGGEESTSASAAAGGEASSRAAASVRSKEETASAGASLQKSGQESSGASTAVVAGTAAHRIFDGSYTFQVSDGSRVTMKVVWTKGKENPTVSVSDDKGMRSLTLLQMDDSELRAEDRKNGRTYSIHYHDGSYLFHRVGY
ncbi:MAG: hypothetical protein HXK81_07150 [Lachnospiraceae bacterium]|nr:hypothetical protein [Lachnospiraceae bacterium]